MASKKAKIKTFALGNDIGIQSGSDRTVYVFWEWTEKNTENYKVTWEYYTANNKWFIGNESTTTNKQSTYSAPTNAKQVKVTVLPIAKYKNKKKTTRYWTATPSTSSAINIPAEKAANDKPDKPSSPTVEIKNGKVTASVNYYATGASHVRFEFVKNNTDVVLTTGWQKLVTNYASYSITAETNASYKVKAQGYNEKTKLSSDWSEYTAASPDTIEKPPVPTVTIANGKLTAYVDVYSASDGNIVEFQIVKNNSSVVSIQGKQVVQVPLSYNHAEFSTSIEVNVNYKVKARVYLSQTTKRYSDWSEYSANQKQDPETLNPLETPATPSVTIANRKLTAEVEMYDPNVTHIQFEVIKNDKTPAVTLPYGAMNVRGLVALSTNKARLNLSNVDLDTNYKVRAYSYNSSSKKKSAWSAYSSNERQDTKPLEAISAPSVSFVGETFKASVDIYNSDAQYLEFQFVKNDTSLVATVKEVKITTNHAEASIQTAAKTRYKARVRWYSKSQTKFSPWSEYSGSEQREVDPIEKPPTPSVSISGTTLKSFVNVYVTGATHIEFQTVKNNTTVVQTKKVAISKNYAQTTLTTEFNASYKTRARVWVGTRYSAYTEYATTDPVEVTKPPVPTVSIENSTFKAYVNVYVTEAKKIEFEIVRNNTTVVQTTQVTINKNYAQITCQAIYGSTYKCRARCVTASNVKSQWSEYGSTEAVAFQAPNAPSVSVTDFTLTAECSVYIADATHIQFQVVKNDKDVVLTRQVAISTNMARTTYTITANDRYKVRARCYGSAINKYSAWSEYASTEPIVFPVPPVPSISITNFTLTSEVSAYIVGATHIQFQIVKEDKDVVKTEQVALSTNNARITYKVAADTRYKVRARAYSSTKKIYSTWSEYSANQLQEKEPLGVPPTPTVEVSNFTLTAKVDIYVELATGVQFQVVKDNSTVVKTVKAEITTNRAAMSCSISAGGKYKVRARSYNKSEYSEWSEYSDEVGTIPGKVSKISSISAQSATSVKLTWEKATDATSYEVEYTEDKTYFDIAPDEVQSLSVEGVTTAIVTGLDSGKAWFFRVRGVNANGNGGFSPIATVTIGAAPGAPTTWSYTTTVRLGDPIIFNWAHNSEDESEQTGAQIEITVNGAVETKTVSGNTMTYSLPTTSYSDGSIIYWRVKTKGAIETYGPWSTKRMVTVYAPPSIELGMYGSVDWLWDTFDFNTDTIYTAAGNPTDLTDEITKFPFYIRANAVPVTQTAVSYVLQVISDEAYDTVDETGMERSISAGEQIYSRYFSPEPGNENELTVKLMPSDIDLENDQPYTVKVTVALDSGLTAEDTYEFSVAWGEDEFEPDAFVTIDDTIFAAYIQPFCTDLYGNDMDGLTLGVYRREYNGTFTAIETGIQSGQDITVTDPHPSLDYARYRIVAVSEKNGDISYFDVPAEPIGHGSVIIQWDEEWTYFEADDASDLAEPPWSGSFLDLPYNVDISIDNKPDVALVEYIGREHPVSYYGTQKGETASWNVTVEKDDSETIYAIRRLANYAGDVYVREPSGIGYWAQVNVSYSMSHNSKEVPVTFGITRVDGGM